MKPWIYNYLQDCDNIAHTLSVKNKNHHNNTIFCNNKFADNVRNSWIFPLSFYSWGAIEKLVGFYQDFQGFLVFEHPDETLALVLK